MRAPKCRTCQQEHWGSICTQNTGTVKTITAPVKRIAKVAPDTKLGTFKGKTIAASPSEPPAIVTDAGLEPIAAPAPKANGRPKIHPDRKAYKAEKERARRAAKKAKP